MKEYGSNVEKLAEYLISIEDREKRTRFAYVLVELMRQIHPQMRDGQDYTNKLWDDLYIISNFKLDVDAPYLPPSPELIGKKPLTVPYNNHDLRYRNYGHNINLLIDKAIATPDQDDKIAFVSYLVRLMKTFFVSMRDIADDGAVLEHLEVLSKGQLKVEIAFIRQNGLVESTPRDRGSSSARDRNFVERRDNRDRSSGNERGGIERGNSERGNNERGNSERNNNDRSGSNDRRAGRNFQGNNRNNPVGNDRNRPNNNAGGGGSGGTPNRNFKKKR